MRIIKQDNNLKESLDKDEMITDVIVKVDADGEASTDEYDDSNKADQDLNELENMSDEELKENEVVGYARLTFDEDDNKFYVSDSYSTTQKYDEDIRVIIKDTIKKYNKKVLNSIKESLTEDQERRIAGDKNLIKNIKEDFDDIIYMLNLLKKDFNTLGIHSTDIDYYLINELEEMSELEDEDGYNLNLAQLYSRLREFEEGSLNSIKEDLNGTKPEQMQLFIQAIDEFADEYGLDLDNLRKEQDITSEAGEYYRGAIEGLVDLGEEWNDYFGKLSHTVLDDIKDMASQKLSIGTILKTLKQRARIY